MHQQSEADRPGASQLPHRQQHLPDGRVTPTRTLPDKFSWATGITTGATGVRKPACSATSIRRPFTTPSTSRGPAPTGAARPTATQRRTTRCSQCIMCPSDPWVGAQESIISTVTWRASARPPNMPDFYPGWQTWTNPNKNGSTGLFAIWISYGISDCVDGTSNTVAYSEAIVGNGHYNTLYKGQGVMNIGGTNPFLYDANTNPQARTRGASALCRRIHRHERGQSQPAPRLSLARGHSGVLDVQPSADCPMTRSIRSTTAE